MPPQPESASVSRGSGNRDSLESRNEEGACQLRARATLRKRGLKRPSDADVEGEAAVALIHPVSFRELEVEGLGRLDPVQLFLDLV